MAERERPSIVGRTIEAIIKKINPDFEQETRTFSLDDYLSGKPINNRWRYKFHSGWSEEWSLSWDEEAGEWQIVYSSGSSGTAALEAEAAGEDPVSQRVVTADPYEVIPWLKRAYLITKDELPEQNKIPHHEIMTFVKEQIPEEVLIQRAKSAIKKHFEEEVEPGRLYPFTTKIIVSGWEKPIPLAS